MQKLTQLDTKRELKKSSGAVKYSLKNISSTQWWTQGLRKSRGCLSLAISNKYD